MSEVAVIDAEVVSPLDPSAAKRLDQRIRLLVSTINDNVEKLHSLVDEAKRGDVHAALGYPSWTAYIADVFTVQVRLDREQRRELVGYLAGEGMSQRAIAEVVGVDHKTVGNDLRTGGEISPPEPDRPVAQPVTDADVDETPAAPATRPNITGMDGKTYRPKQKPKPEPKPEPVSPPRITFSGLMKRLSDLTKIADEALDIATELTFDGEVRHHGLVYDSEEQHDSAVELAENLVDIANAILEEIQSRAGGDA